MDDERVGVRNRFAGHVHGHLWKIVSQLDTKVTFLAGLASGAIVYCIRDLGALAVIFSAPEFELASATTAEWLTILAQIFATIATILFGLCVYVSLAVIQPRYGKVSADGIMFFRSIAKNRSPDDYVNLVSEKSDQEIVDAVLADAYNLSSIASKKSRRAGFATSLFKLAIIALMASVILANFPF